MYTAPSQADNEDDDYLSNESDLYGHYGAGVILNEDDKLYVFCNPLVLETVLKQMGRGSYSYMKANVHDDGSGGLNPEKFSAASKSDSARNRQSLRTMRDSLEIPQNNTDANEYKPEEWVESYSGSGEGSAMSYTTLAMDPTTKPTAKPTNEGDS